MRGFLLSFNKLCGPIKRTGDVFIDPTTFAPLVTLEVEFNLIQG